MKKIVILVDYTDTALISVKQGIAIAGKHHSKITVLHIADSEAEKLLLQAENRYEAYTSQLQIEGIPFDVHIGVGDFMEAIPAYVKESNPDLVIVGTHGKHGLKQSLLGSNIYRLVKRIKSAVLVVNDMITAPVGEYQRIMLPVAAHDNYLLKVEDSLKLLATGGTIVIFAINKPGLELVPEILKNIEGTKALLTKRSVNFEYLELDSMRFSVGYSKETLSLVNEHKIDLIGIMSMPSDIGTKSAIVMDKENIILNKEGLPVLCSNE